MQVYIKNRVRRKEEFQFFMHDFVDACKLAGIKSKKDLFPSYRWHVRAVLREILLLIYQFVHSFFPMLLNRKEALLVAANGMSIKDNSFPYYGSFEIIPVLWDVWPYTWKRMYNSLRLLDVHVVFVTSRQVVDMINKETSIHAYWLPEGIRPSLYQNIHTLANRQYDVFEMGRRYAKYHAVVNLLCKEQKIKVVSPCNLNDNGTLDDKNVAYTDEELHALMSETRIMVCFPQCDTNPYRAGEIETLTLRYWEAMLSGCIMVGRAPIELVDLIGYNPVIEVDWKRPQEQLYEILSCISKYQALSNRNYEVAKEYAPWTGRISMLIRSLLREGYVG